MAFQTPITIKEAIDHIHNNRYLLPAIQREFVWWPHQIERLFDSLMRGYPIGSFLFWRVDPETAKDYSFYQFITNYELRSTEAPQSRPRGAVQRARPEGGARWTTTPDGAECRTPWQRQMETSPPVVEQPGRLSGTTAVLESPRTPEGERRRTLV